MTRAFRRGGLDLLNVSVAFSIPETNIPRAPTFLAPIAERVRRAAELPVASAWGIDAPATANRAVAEHQMDLVMVGRTHLANPHWPYHAALALYEEKPTWVLPAPYAHWLAKWRPSA